MKPVLFMSGFVLLLLLASCSTQKKSVVTTGLQFRWNVPLRFQVIETIQKKETEIQIIHNCKLLQTNEEFELQWLDARILEVNGEKVADSEELKRAVKPLEASFVYPSFRVNQSGQFAEVINPEESVKRTDQMLDVVATNRSEDSRKFFVNFAKTETGKQVLNGVFGQIWQTWVGAWVGVELAEGQTSADEGMTMVFGSAEMPAKVKLTNWGTMKSDTNLLSLKYECELAGTNFTAALNDLIGKTTKETGITGAGPITNECTIKLSTILEVQTEKKTLKPHWAKRTLITTVSAVGEDAETALEVHEYQFFWDSNLKK